MPQYTVTYLQEVHHVIEQPDVRAAGARAKEYARQHNGLRVMTVYLKGTEPKPELTTATSAA